VLAILGNAAVFNALLYKGHFPKKNIPGSILSFYDDAFTRLFSQGPARENFFLQMVFFGELKYAEGNPSSAIPTCTRPSRRGCRAPTSTMCKVTSSR